LKKEMSELEVSKILEVSASTMVGYRRNGTIPKNLYTEKKYVSGVIRYKYDREKFSLWIQSKIDLNLQLNR
jgi:hypothetical protein